MIKKAQYPKNQNAIKYASLNNDANIRNYLIQTERAKKRNLSNLPLNNNCKIVYNFKHTYNLYFNNNLEDGKNYISSFYNINDLFDKNDELLYIKYKKIQNNNNI